MYKRAGLEYNNPRARYIGGYLGFAIAFVILTMLRALLNLYSAWGASGKIYRQSLGVRIIGQRYLFPMLLQSAWVFACA